MAPNAVMKSPRMPPCPPTSAVSPSGGLATTSRMAATAVWISSPSEDATGTTTCAAVPSVEYDGAATAAASTCATSLSSAPYPAIACLSAAVSPPGALEDHDRGQRLLPGERQELVEHPGGLGALRQEGGVVVLLHLREPARERAQRSADEQPQQDHDDGQHPALGPAGAGGAGGAGGCWRVLTCDIGSPSVRRRPPRGRTPWFHILPHATDAAPGGSWGGRSLGPRGRADLRDRRLRRATPWSTSPPGTCSARCTPGSWTARRAPCCCWSTPRSSPPASAPSRTSARSATTSRSSTSTAAARSPSTGPASWSATRSSGCPTTCWSWTTCAASRRR